MTYLDSHVHIPLLNLPSSKVLDACAEKNITLLLNVGYDLLSSQQSLELSIQHDSVYSAVGLHPHYVSEEQWRHIKDWSAQDQIFKHTRLIAWGEIGLDYVRSQVSHESQQYFFDQQLQWAYQKRLPVLIHNREADQDILRLLSKYPGIKGVMHCYSSSDDSFADQVLAMNFLISFAGNLSYPKSQFLRDLAQRMPLESLLLETDAPYLAPIPFRGRENHPIHVLELYQLVAKIRKIDESLLAQAVENNFHRLFGSIGGLNETIT
jgi:TatD DNase family protein